uniref:Na+/H+ antiporter NhaA n=1 Tax=Phaeomonas parva TaxID=124430 RepID=A0A6U4EXD0_9STRA|mmetsp:Transcript_22329/g.68889  ORF Transcript_22329/g.68889 Transcript_22329/m.68889 type:complete len:489 (+) Transcript_22329:81-1547(+)
MALRGVLAAALAAVAPVAALRRPAFARHLRLPLRPKPAPLTPVRALGDMVPFDDNPAVAAQQTQCDVVNPSQCSKEEDMPKWLQKLAKAQESGLGSAALLAATALSLSLANSAPTSAAWLNFWSSPMGPAIGGHALSPRGWVNEGLMTLFFFVVGLEIKQELRLGSLSSPKKALLPCIAALGGMAVPMLVYLGVQMLPAMAGGSLTAVTVPMATDIAFAMAIFGFFRTRMPPSASVFLLTLATVDDLGAIFVLATCFASNIAPKFLASAAGVTAGLGSYGRTKATDLRIFATGTAALWWCLLRAGVGADIAGVIAALCISTRAVVGNEPLTEKLITWLSPIATFLVMPAFALANTAVPLSGILNAGTGAVAQTVAPAMGILFGLLVGKPLGIFGATWLATRLGMAEMPVGMTKRHLGVVSVLGAIGFTMCLLLTEVAMPTALQPLPKLAVLTASAAASVAGAVAMWRMPKRTEAAVPATEAVPAPATA